MADFQNMPSYFMLCIHSIFIQTTRFKQANIKDGESKSFVISLNEK
jgi:hypothetical protein